MTPYPISDNAFWNMVWNTVWQEADQPILTVYILSLLPILRRVHDSAIESLRSVVVVGADAFDRTVAEVSTRGLRREWVAAGVGAGAGLLLLSPWSGPDFHFWPIKLYLLLSTALLYGLVGWFIYISLSIIGGVTLATALATQPGTRLATCPVPRLTSRPMRPRVTCATLGTGYIGFEQNQGIGGKK